MSVITIKNNLTYEYVNMGGYLFPFKLIDYTRTRNGQVMFNYHWHEHLEILYITYGEATLFCDSREYHAVAGDIVLFNPGQLHKGVYRSDIIRYYVLLIDIAKLIDEPHSTLSNTEFTQIAQNLILFHNVIQGDAQLQEIIRQIFDEYARKDKFYGIAIKAFVYHLIAEILRKHVDRFLDKNEYVRRIRKLERYSDLLNYIDNNLNSDLCIDQLAQMVSVSKYHFAHMFKNLTGKTLRNYINEVRVEKAEVLLKTTPLNISEIAAAIGCDDSNYFCRIFKKTTGLSPSQYRNT